MDKQKYLENLMNEEDFNLYELNEDHIANIKKEFINNDIDLTEAKRVLNKYYKIDISDEILKKIISNNHILILECFQNTISDTYARDILINELTNFFNLPLWPVNSDSDNYVNDFIEKIEKINEIKKVNNTINNTIKF